MEGSAAHYSNISALHTAKARNACETAPAFCGFFMHETEKFVRVGGR